MTADSRRRFHKVQTQDKVMATEIGTGRLGTLDRLRTQGRARVMRAPGEKVGWRMPYALRVMVGVLICVTLVFCETAAAANTHRIGHADDTWNGPCSANGGFWWRANNPQVIGSKTFSTGFYAYGGREIQGQNRYCLDLVLSGQYRRFKGTIGMIDDGPPDVRQRMQLVADGRILYEREGGLGESYKFDLDVRGVRRVVFRTYCVGRCSYYNITQAKGGITGRLIAL